MPLSPPNRVRNATRRQFIMDVLDFWIPAANLELVHLNDGFLGLCGYAHPFACRSIVTKLPAVSLRPSSHCKPSGRVLLRRNNEVLVYVACLCTNTVMHCFEYEYINVNDYAMCRMRAVWYSCWAIGCYLACSHLYILVANKLHAVGACTCEYHVGDVTIIPDCHSTHYWYIQSCMSLYFPLHAHATERVRPSTHSAKSTA